jgi:RNA polymerase sigma-70 factor (ECF subfamily)
VPGAAPPTALLAAVHDQYQTLYRYAFRLTGAVAEAEDLTQQTFLTAQQKWDQLRDPDKVRGWLFAILRRCYLKGRRKPVPVPWTNLDADRFDPPQDIPEDAIDSERIQEAINQLPDEFKLPVVMFYFEQCSYREIAAQLQIPLGTVMSRLSRGKAHLRRRLEAGRNASSSAPSAAPPHGARYGHQGGAGENTKARVVSDG